MNPGYDQFPTDYSKFDHSAPFWAMALITTLLLPAGMHAGFTNSYYNNQFMEVEGQRFRVTSGLMSGNKLTSAAGSIINLYY